MKLDFNELNFELRCKEIATKETYKATNIDFYKKEISGYSLKTEKKKTFSFDEVRISAFTRIYDSEENKIFENDLVLVKLKDSRVKSIIGSVVNSRGNWIISDRRTKTKISITDPKIININLFKVSK